mgnify:CR=1 FL=1
MNINYKIIILSCLLIGLLSVGVYSKTSINKLDEKRDSYHKISKELHIIKQIDSYYGEKRKNKGKVNSIIGKYSNRIVYKKANKKSIEFKVSKLNNKTLDKLNKEILNAGLKISMLKITRINNQLSEFSCKVVF